MTFTLHTGALPEVTPLATHSGKRLVPASMDF